MSATVDTHSCLSLVVLITWRVLLFCAEHLFGAVWWQFDHWEAGQQALWVSTFQSRRYARTTASPASMQGGLRRDDLRLARLGGDDDPGRAGGGRGVRAAQRRPGARPEIGAAAVSGGLLFGVTFDPSRGYA